MLKFLDKIELQYNDIPQLFSLREKGRHLLTTMPNKKTEAYKYTPVIAALTDEMFTPPLHQKTYEHNHCCCHEHILPVESYDFHFCNGILHEHFHPTPGIEFETILEAISNHTISNLINNFNIEKFPFAALNTACLEEGLVLRISKEIKKPIALFYAGKENCFRNIRNIIVVEKGATAEIIEIFENENDVSFTNIVNEIFVSSNASLTHYKFQKQSPQAVHIALNNVKVKADGKYESYTIQTGGKLARNETHVILREEGAETRINAAYCLKGSSLVDTTTDVAHLCEKTTSNQLIKGVVDNSAHGIFQGKIHIAQKAVQTEGYQLHKALLLSDASGVDVKPELEIFADDVKCSHGSTTGDLNENELFYLKSRGLSDQDARNILITAFLEEAFSDIKNESIKDLFHFILAPNR